MGARESAQNLWFRRHKMHTASLESSPRLSSMQVGGERWQEQAEAVTALNLQVQNQLS